jgi:diacylglycerol kinase family enzyme
MYYYLVDPKHYQGRNFEFFQSQLLSLLTEYHVSGEMSRVTRLRTVEDLVATALSHGTTTLVVVGDDETFHQAVSVCHGKSVVLGYIPINPGSEIGEILGVESVTAAVAVIAKRRVEQMDVVKIGAAYFISNVHFGPAFRAAEDELGQWRESGERVSWRKLSATAPVKVGLEFNGAFRAWNQCVAGAIISARAAEGKAQESGKPLGNPGDGVLDAVLAGRPSFFSAWRYRRQLEEKCYEYLPGSSIMHGSRVAILEPAGLPIFLSGRVIGRAPATVEITGEKLRVVVGKARQF